MRKAILKVLLITLLTLAYTFIVVNYFYENLSKIWFLITMNIFGVPVWIVATNLANRIMRQETDFKIAVHESLMRNFIGWGLLIVVGLLIVHFVSKVIIL